MSQDMHVMYQFPTGTFPCDEELTSGSQVSAAGIQENRLNGVSTIDFHITARCSQACPYCWGPRRFRSPVATETAQRIIARIKQLGVGRVVFTGGDPLQRADAPELVRFAKETGLETALSTTGDRVTPEILASLSPYLDLISLPLDGSTEAINARTKHPGHFAAVMRSLDWLRAYPHIDVKVCTPVTRHNLSDVPAIAGLVEAYARTTRSRVFYNVFQAFPRAMFNAHWEKMLVSDGEFSQLKEQVGVKANFRINYLSHATLDRLYFMVFPDGSLTVPKGAEYLNFGPFLEVGDYEQVLKDSQFDSAKHMRHSRGWGKGQALRSWVLDGSGSHSLNALSL
jgi:MoaA/NifB/PqqE/SkfB family radical SAM enzyme